MSKAIQVLEQMGSDAGLQSEQAIGQLLTTAEVNVDQAEAIINKDVVTLERQLDVRHDIICFVGTPDEDDEDEDKDKDNKDEKNSVVIGF